VMGAPRTGRRSEVFSDTVDFVLKHAPCRVMVAAGRKAA
jgi:nucleotide-binding universal stress UspA family protein